MLQFHRRSWLQDHASVPITFAYVAVAVLLGSQGGQLGGRVIGNSEVSPVAAASAITILSAIASGTMALTGIVFALVFVAFQVGGTAYSPRVVDIIGRNRFLGHALGVFTGTFIYALLAIRTVDIAGSPGVNMSVIAVALLWLFASVAALALLLPQVRTLSIAVVLPALHRYAVVATARVYHALDRGVPLAIQAPPRGEPGPGVGEGGRDGGPGFSPAMPSEARRIGGPGVGEGGRDGGPGFSPAMPSEARRIGGPGVGEGGRDGGPGFSPAMPSEARRIGGPGVGEGGRDGGPGFSPAMPSEARRIGGPGVGEGGRDGGPGFSPAMPSEARRIGGPGVGEGGRDGGPGFSPAMPSEARRIGGPGVGEGGRTHELVHRGEPCYLVGLDVRRIVRFATAADAVVVLPAAIGDAIISGDVIAAVVGASRPITEAQLRRALWLQRQRTPENDPAYAIRLLVDIAIRALSPAVNDPTTAVSVVDELDGLLRLLGSCALEDNVVLDDRGVVRLVRAVSSWDDLVALALTEIHEYGRDSIQVQRRLAALLHDLARQLPAYRRPAIERFGRWRADSQSEVLHAATAWTDAFAFDRQGLGHEVHATEDPRH